MKLQTIIFVGSINVGGIADDGETMKNRILVDALENSKHCKVMLIDTRHRPVRFLYLLKYFLLLLFLRNSKLVFSASSFVTYKMLRIANLLRYNLDNIYYWVIGGKFADYVNEGSIPKQMYLKLNKIFVEGDSMVKQLHGLGFQNVIVLPNFKKIDYIPPKTRTTTYPVRFVFLSRIIPEKGVDLILNAAKVLNGDNENKYIIDFYGRVDDVYQTKFKKKVEELPNVRYQGFLSFAENAGYDTLATYDAMLFPTYWVGEGFPGIIIDAYIAGLPIIASDWNLNSQIIKNNKTGVIIPAKDNASLIKTMQDIIDGKVEITLMSKFAQNEARKYDVRHILNDEFFKEIGLYK